MTLSEWQSQQVTVSSGDNLNSVPPANCRIITERFERRMCLPYIVYMPERDRLLLLVSCDSPCRPMLMSSDDRGETWTDPCPMIPENAQGKSCLGIALTYMGNGRAAASVSVYPSSDACRSRIFSQDYGATWSDPIPIPLTSAGQDLHPWDPWLVDTDPASGSAIRIAETGYTHSNDVPYGGRSQAFIRFSDDGGVTWSDEIAPPTWDGVDEVFLCRAANGDIVASCRLNPPHEYWQEIDHYEGLGASRSRDNGHTWSDVNVLYPWGRHHASIVLLPDGDIVMSHVVRKGYPDTSDGYPQFGIEAVISRDHGASWDMPHRYILAQWRGNTRGEDPELERQFRAKWPRWWASGQSTSTTLLPDATILTAFGTGYRSRPSDSGECSPKDVGLVKWRVGQ